MDKKCIPSRSASPSIRCCQKLTAINCEIFIVEVDIYFQGQKIILSVDKNYVFPIINPFWRVLH